MVKNTEKIKEKNKKTIVLQGSFTVEAALLMMILLPVLVSVIYLSFFVHDRAVLQGISCEIGAMGSNLGQEKKAEAILKEKQRELLKNRLLGTRNIRNSLSVSKTQVAVTFSGSYPFPGLIMELIGGKRLSIKRSWSRELYYPAKRIRKIRGLNELVDTLKE